MAIPTGITLIGSVVKIGSTEIQDGTVEISMKFSRTIAKAKVLTGTVSAVGPMEGSGTIKAIYDETTDSPHKLLQAELLTPTTGGIALVMQPKGTSSGNEEYSFNIVVGDMDLSGNGDDILQTSFSVETTGAITVAAQV